MHKSSIAILALLAACHAGAAIANDVVTVNVADDPPGPSNCPTTCSLRQAIAYASPGDTIEFDPSVPSPIKLNGTPLVIDKDHLIINGPGAGKLTITAQNLSRVLMVSATSAIIWSLTFADGVFAGQKGKDEVDKDANGNGKSGGIGEAAYGGCIYVEANAALHLAEVAVRHCVARGGQGGQGAAGRNAICLIPDPDGKHCTTGTAAGHGGLGGSGGLACGGAIDVGSGGTLTMFGSSVVDGQTVGGTGGTGGSGGAGSTGFSAGQPGGGGSGGPACAGAIYALGDVLKIENSTLASSAAVGGDGGNAATNAGNAGWGGGAQAGLLTTFATTSSLRFSTFALGDAAGGDPGAVGTGGFSGMAQTSALRVGGTTTVSSNIIMGTEPGVALCDGTFYVEGSSFNLSEDTSCSGFNLHASFAQTLRPLDMNMPLPALMPVWRSAAIDAAGAAGYDLWYPWDQYGTSRPQGAWLDLGAIEADYIFVDGFDSN